MQRLLLALALCTAVALPTGTASAQTLPFCSPGQSPRFVFGFAALKAALGDQMGEPLECEHANPANGDSLQQTTTGLAFYRKATNTPTFTNGYEHWALTPDGLVSWTGRSIDPPASENVGEPEAAVLVELPTDWAVGDRRRVALVQEQETYRGGERVAVAQRFAPGEQPTEDPPALSLLVSRPAPVNGPVAEGVT